MMQVQRLAIEVARRLADLQKLLDRRMGDIEITGCRAATQRALADRQRKRIHQADERHDAAGLAIEAKRLTNAAHIAPISADAPTTRSKPDIPDTGDDDPLSAITNALTTKRAHNTPAGPLCTENHLTG